MILLAFSFLLCAHKKELKALQFAKPLWLLSWLDNAQQQILKPESLEKAAILKELPLLSWCQNNSAERLLYKCLGVGPGQLILKTCSFQSCCAAQNFLGTYFFVCFHAGKKTKIFLDDFASIPLLYSSHPWHGSCHWLGWPRLLLLTSVLYLRLWQPSITQIPHSPKHTITPTQPSHSQDQPITNRS